MAPTKIYTPIINSRYLQKIQYRTTAEAEVGRTDDDLVHLPQALSPCELWKEVTNANVIECIVIAKNRSRIEQTHIGDASVHDPQQCKNF